MPEVVDFIKIVSRGVVLQLNVTTLTPLAKVTQPQRSRPYTRPPLRTHLARVSAKQGMLYRDFLCLVVSTTDLIPLGLYRTDRETVPVRTPTSKPLLTHTLSLSLSLT
jgi:hypothetical protein